MTDQLKQIKEGWSNFFKGHNVDPHIKEIAQARADICATCPHYKASAVYGVLNQLSALVTDVVDINSVKGEYCGLCGCKFPQGWLTPEKVCPDNPPRWEAEKIET